MQCTVVNVEMLACSRCAYGHQAEHSFLNNISMWPHKAQETMEKKCWKECMKQEGERLWNAVFWAWTSQCSNDTATARAAWDGSAQDWTCSNLFIRLQLIIDQGEAHVQLNPGILVHSGGGTNIPFRWIPTYHVPVMAAQMAPADLNGSQQDTERLESERGTCGRRVCKGWEESVW